MSTATPAPPRNSCNENATKDWLTVYVTAALPDKSKAYQFETVNGLRCLLQGH